jgi:hypothetical protein
MVTALWLVGGLAGCECGASETATPTPEAPAPATPAAVDVPVDDWIDIPRPAFDGGCFDAQRNAAVRDVVCGGLRARVSAAQVQWADDVTAEPIVALRRIGEDEWVFVTRDGLAHHAASFVGALETRPRASGSIDRADFERERLQAPHGDPTITPRWIDDRARA